MTPSRLCRLAGLALIAAAIAGASGVHAQSRSADARQPVMLPPAGRDKVLAEMRGMLASVSGVVAGLGAKDRGVAEKAARASGMGAAADMDREVESQLPREFRDLGMKTHHGLDALADRIKAGAPEEEVLHDLAGVMGNCVTCHATYRLEEAR